jgi:hypothetical protein
MVMGQLVHTAIRESEKYKRVHFARGRVFLCGGESRPT